ncbi:MAG: hypothetical protein AAFV07_01855 [Bacteroidota bacterium]
MRIFQITIALAISLLIGVGHTHANGGEQQKKSSSNTLVAKATAEAPTTEAPNGAIFGSVVGKARTVANIFSVSLYAADQTREFISSQPLQHDGQFSFEALPDGTYWMFVESQGPTVIEAFPSAIKITVVNGQASKQDVELR